MNNIVLEVLQRDLKSLSREIEMVYNDEDLWVTLPGISNSIGNLTTHLCGNLRHFIGHVIGGSNYQRQRDLEFSVSGLPAKNLQELILTTKEEVENAMNLFDPSSGSKSYPLEIAGRSTTYHGALIILCTHLSYHIGQVNYLRRIISKSDSNE